MRLDRGRQSQPNMTIRCQDGRPRINDGSCRFICELTIHRAKLTTPLLTMKQRLLMQYEPRRHHRYGIKILKDENGDVCKSRATVEALECRHHLEKQPSRSFLSRRQPGAWHRPGRLSRLRGQYHLQDAGAKLHKTQNLVFKNTRMAVETHEAEVAYASAELATLRFAVPVRRACPAICKSLIFSRS